MAEQNCDFGAVIMGEAIGGDPGKIITDSESVCYGDAGITSTAGEIFQILIDKRPFDLQNLISCENFHN
jgi:hypothetical protein